jgi:hypothetical protein
MLDASPLEDAGLLARVLEAPAPELGCWLDLLPPAAAGK